MSKNLVIVESPAKAKTIEGYLGKDYIVASSYGHVRDLRKGNNAIDIENNFTPTYEISKDKKEIIKNLKKLAKKSSQVYLASDDDREGEAIAWHLTHALELDEKNTRRIVFREITKSAITKAIAQPRTINTDLVNAQQARRVLDRLVGFELSPVLWKKIKRGLSAGRVQSVAVRVIVDRERQIEKFKPNITIKVSALFSIDKKTFKAELPKRFDTISEAKSFLEECNGAVFTIAALETKPTKKSPSAPFTTSTLQQEASRKLGFSVSQTMTLAQKLYENGKITYMRTDSLSLSKEAIKSALSEITSAYGSDYVQQRTFKTKDAGAQEAHEAIRPTSFSTYSVNFDRGAARLYELIWKRAIASQMADAQLEKTVAHISVSTSNYQLVSQGEMIKFEGFLKVYNESTGDGESREKETMLPPLAKDDSLKLENMLARQIFTRSPARYTEGSLVKKLEEIGIGRPSTYAPTISTIQKREYIEKESKEGVERAYEAISLVDNEVILSTKKEITGVEKNKLLPTDTGMIVTDFLVAHFDKILDYSFTATVEKDFDKIANGKKQWSKMIGNFYKEFHPSVEASEQLDRKEVGGSRNLGNDPKTGLPIIARLGKFGPLVQLGEQLKEGEEGEPPKFASMNKGQFIESITLEDAVELFKLPRNLGNLNEKEVVVAKGRFGPYVRHNNKFISIKNIKEDNPITITLERAIELIKEKEKEDEKKHIKSFEEDSSVQVLNGRYGPYIKVGKQNIKIPKDKTPHLLTLEECLKLAKNAPPKRRKIIKKK